MIRLATTADAESISSIYNLYVRESVATFETEEVTPTEMQIRISNTIKKYPWLVFEEDKKIIGFAYASSWRVRAAYFNSVESTVYLHPDKTGKGTGKKLYTCLFELLKEKNIHVVIGGIALPNDASVALHEKLGFTKVAHFKEVGLKFGRWVDVAYWQKML
jgi:L-amino acid N-acyltransferase YncA